MIIKQKTKDDCLPCTLASLTHIPYEKIPFVNRKLDDKSAWQDFIGKLGQIGITLEVVKRRPRTGFVVYGCKINETMVSHCRPIINSREYEVADNRKIFDKLIKETTKKDNRDTIQFNKFYFKVKVNGKECRG